MRAAPELDNLIDAGTNFRNSPDGTDEHHHPNAVGGFDYFDTIFKVGNEYYYGLVNIEVLKKASKKNVGRLAVAVSEQIETKSKTDLTEKLVANGVEEKTAKTAKTLSGIVNDVWMGRDTSTESRQLLEAAAKDPKINNAIEAVYSEIAPMVKRMGEISSGKPVTSNTAGQVKPTSGEASNLVQPNGQENQPTVFAEDVQDVADGTFVKSTGAAVDTVEIASVGENATVTVNGTETVPLSDVSWESEATAYHYTAVTKADSMTPAAANRILSNPKASSTAFISEALRAFNGGVRNDARVLGDLNSGVISAEEARALFTEGRKAAEAQVTARDAEVKAKQKTATEDGSAAERKGGVFYEYDGKTIKQRNDGKHKPLTKKQRVAVDFTKRLTKKFGSTVYFYESYLDENGKRVFKDRDGNIVEAKEGFYDPSDGSIHVDLNGDNILFTISHELVHFIRDWSPLKFQLMADLVMEGFNRQGLTAEELIEAKQADYAKDGIQLTDEEAFEEVIAAALEGIMADGRVMELMQKTEAKDKGLSAKVKQFFQDIAELIRSTVSAYQDAVPDSPEGRLIRKLEDIYAQLQEAFAEGIMDAGTNFQNAENTTNEGGVRYKLANIKDVTPSNDRLKRNKISVAYMKSVFDVSADKLIPGETSIKDQYKKYWSEWGENISTERFGDIAVKNSSMRSEMRHGSTPVKVASIAAIPSVIKYGEIVDWFEKNTGLFRITVAAPIRIGEKPYIMGVMLQRDDQNQRLYIHDVEIDEEASVSTQEHLDSTGPYDSNNDLFLSTVLHEIVEVKTKIQKNNDRAIKHFGKTYKWAETGYLLADGSKLDFSGRHEGASGGYRTVDHRDILDIYPEDTELDGNGAMVDFMSQGNIRIMPEGDGINLQVQPTKAQERALDDFISRVRGEVTLDIDDSNGNTVVSVEYPRGTRSSKVLQDIRNYFTDGTEPVISGLTRFRYSIGSKTDSAMQKLLEKENESLREDVARLKELLKLQGTETHGTRFTPSSVEAAARYLKKNAGAKGDTKTLAKLLNGFYEYIATNKDLTWDDVREQAKPIANWLMDHVEHGRSDYAQEVLDQIRGSRIYLDESQMEEAAYRFESYDTYRKSLMGSVTFAKDADVSLDSWWHDMAVMYPDVFDPAVTAADMPSELADVIDRLRNENTSAPALLSKVDETTVTPGQRNNLGRYREQLGAQTDIIKRQGH